jgi:hypothetical protein
MLDLYASLHKRADSGLFPAVFYIENLDEDRLREEIENIVEIIRDEELEITKQC